MEKLTKRQLQNPGRLLSSITALAVLAAGCGDGPSSDEISEREKESIQSTSEQSTDTNVGIIDFDDDIKANNIVAACDGSSRVYTNQIDSPARVLTEQIVVIPNSPECQE